MLRHLKEFFSKRKWRYVFGIFFLILVDIIQLAVPQILKTVTNSLVGENFSELKLWGYAALILLAGLGIGICRFAWRSFIIWSAADLETWLRSKFFRHLIHLPQSFYHEHKTGDLMAHATNDLFTIRRTFSGGIIMSVDALFITISTVVVMASSINPVMTLFAMIPLPLMSIVVLIMGKKLHAKFRSVQEGFSMLSDKVQESFAGIEVIKAFAQEDENHEDFNRYNEDNFQRNMDLVKIHALMHNLVNMIGSLSFAIGIILGSKYTFAGIITLGDLVAFLQYLDLLMWPMAAFGMFANMMQRGAASIERINVLLDTSSDLHDQESIDEPENLNLEIKDLSFTYPGETIPALSNVNLSIPQGSNLGIIGHTGSGKTTLVSLLQRLYNIPRGKIYIDGLDINDISIEDTRDLISSVPQDVFLFSTMIKDNIAFTDREADMDKVVSTAKTAHVHEEIVGFPEGYETYLGERGVNLSGGQRQRTAIARLLYKNSPVMIFDDSLSAVDTKTESEILESLKNSQEKRSSIVISHRVSTLHGLDKIILIKDGKIIEEGTHEELVAINGNYARLFRKQQIEEKIKAHELEKGGKQDE